MCSQAVPLKDCERLHNAGLRQGQSKLSFMEQPYGVPLAFGLKCGETDCFFLNVHNLTSVCKNTTLSLFLSEISVEVAVMLPGEQPKLLTE